MQSNVIIAPKYENKIHALLLSNFIGGCSIPIIRKDLLVRAGKFDENLPASQDIDMWIRVLSLCDYKHIDKPLVNYYISDGSITRNLEKQNAARKRLLEKYCDEYEKYSDAKEAIVERITITYVLQKKYSTAIEYFKENSIFNRGKRVLKSIELVCKGTVKIIVNAIRGYN